MGERRDQGDPGRKGKCSYPLYANLEKAQENSLSEVPTTTLSLSAETLPDVQAGSVVLYRKFAVGEIIAVKPKAMHSISICISSRVPLPADQQQRLLGGRRCEGQLDGNGLTIRARRWRARQRGDQFR